VRHVCILLAAASGLSFGQTLTVSPSRVLCDESAAVRAAGLQPAERVTIRSELTDGAGARWTASADFAADDSGAVDVTRQAPIGGSYKEISPMGLIWFMMPAGKGVNAYAAPRELGPQIVEFELMRKGEKVASARLQQDAMAEGVRRIVVRDGALRGLLFVPAGAGQSTAVLIVGGSNGGVPSRQAAWLASRGFLAFALGYFHFDDLPAELEAIPLEYFQQGLSWLTKRPEAAPGKLAVMGTSRGGELALQLGSMFPAIGAVVAYVPANVRYPSCCRNDGGPAWTWAGRPLPYALPRLRNPQSDIEVERTHGPVLMISGGSDGVWHSSQMADDVVSRLKRHHFEYSYENLKYAHAGHAAGRPEIRPAWHGATRHPISGRVMDIGGSPKGDAESSMDAMPKVLAFLRAFGEGKRE
jgi:dienelactone hydrolase